MLVSRHSVGTLSANELTRNSSGNTRPQSSQLAKQLWTNPGVKSGISVRKLISTLKKEEKKEETAKAENELSNILPKSSHARKCYHHHHHHNFFFFYDSQMSKIVIGCHSCD